MWFGVTMSASVDQDLNLGVDNVLWPSRECHQLYLEDGGRGRQLVEGWEFSRTGPASALLALPCLYGSWFGKALPGFCDTSLGSI
ncbi:hypothetical protein Pcinc_008770 [Petrolisthes cinctipes]|uniref:Uncharacterized protein n=1 Tax=Petrolisthes cinctipes TaxID=88211 RepID=A0AAE1G864_PETCI|nr:hypothetical protein Pcinc_008770 [Petrolisthes cinctipes]